MKEHGNPFLDSRRGNPMKKTQRDGKWSPRPKGVLKINVDGSIE